MTSLVAAIVSWWVFVLGFVLGYIFGDYVKNLGVKVVDLAWQLVKHAVVDFYQTIKNKFFH